MKQMTLVVGLFAAMLSGCAGSVNGTVGGVNLSVADAIFAVLKDDAGKSLAALVFLADKPKLCDSLKANREPKQATSLVLAMARYNANGEVLAPDVAEYTVNNSPTSGGDYATGYFARTDANCTNTLANDAATGKSGLVKVTNFKGDSTGSANGTFDITFGSGDKVSGNFNATYCDISKIQTNPNCE